MTKYMVFPWNMNSEGAKMLADALGGKRIRQVGSTYTPTADDVVINWGNGYGRTFGPALFLNPSVNICIDKREFFKRMQGHNIVPPFAFSRDEALRHLSFPIICRNSTEGADGAGISIANSADEVTDARLFTQLVEKVAEYRVHMGRMPDGSVELICAQKKRVIGNSRPFDDIWTGQDVVLDWCDPQDLPRAVFDVTKRSMEQMPELHFGGFDTIVTPQWGARVVEVNSAPMMTPQSTLKYVDFIKRYVELARPATPAPTDLRPVEVYEPSEAEIDRVVGNLYAGRFATLRDVVRNSLILTGGISGE